MMNHSGKKLLVLGATAYSINVINLAHKMGASVIVVDPVKNRVAKKYADRSYDLDTTNIEELYRIALEEKIDGVFTGYSDVGIWFIFVESPDFFIMLSANSAQLIKPSLVA